MDTPCHRKCGIPLIQGLNTERLKLAAFTRYGGSMKYSNKIQSIGYSHCIEICMLFIQIFRLLTHALPVRQVAKCSSLIPMTTLNSSSAMLWGRCTSSSALRGNSSVQLRFHVFPRYNDLNLKFHRVEGKNESYKFS